MKNLKIAPFLLCLLLTCLLWACSAKKTVAETPVSPPKKDSVAKKPSKVKEEKPLVLPEVKREFRAAWIATVANINWPSSNTLPVSRQKEEALAILDRLKDANFNAVVFQARPSADAFYPSDLEPWSYYLTGTEGKAPSPYYDPLEFWISEAHKRGMELHVWLNPYRAHHTTGGPVTSESMASKMKNVTYRLRNGMYWMDPSHDEVQDHASAVIKDLVKRYDLDAVHIDDYFYPYKEYNGGRDFPDTKTYSTYLASGGTLSRPDWRRGNVNKFIKRIHEEIKAEKPWVKFGISPFGIWKPGYPADVVGSSQYDELYADAKLWLNEGWLDYFSPQLYWKEEGPQRFSSLLTWWESENTLKRHLWPGLNTVGIKGVQDAPSEIKGQMSTIRRVMGEGAGEIHYSVDGLLKNPSMYSAVKSEYSMPALVPLSPWINHKPLDAPLIQGSKEGALATVKWTSRNGDSPFQWVLFKQYGDDWSYEILSEKQSEKKLALSSEGKPLKGVAVKAVDRLGNLSPYALYRY